MLKRTILVALLAVTMAFTMGCGFLGNLIGGGGGGTVATLWSDVPTFPGTTKADLEMPLAAKIAIQAMFQGKVDFIAFKTNQPVQSVIDFYTQDRMKSSGWNSDTVGCQGGTGESGSQGAICFYGKKEGDKEFGLAIFIAQDDKTKETHLFYARIDVTSTPTPKK